MMWFFLALGAPILWAIVNVADKYLVAKFSQKEKERSSGGLVLFASFIAIFIAFLIWLFIPDVSNIPIFDKILLMVTGTLTVVWIILYLFTLETEEISTVVPWFLTVPIFGFVLGYIFLGETLSFKQILGSLVTLFGLLIIASDFSEEGGKFKWKPAIYMIIACFLVATSGIIFKYVTVEENFWVSSFWEYIGLGGTGLLIFLFASKYRRQFIRMMRTGGRKIFVVNAVTEVMTVSGNLLTNFALLLAPVAMVYLIGSFQPAFVLFLTLLSTSFFPHIAKENLNKYSLFPKITAIGIMIIGTIILFM
ncbi:DMT family transporter [Patescibacteria group bacterium]|nr:DMT family transporter [Patescibacteria group bacterium]MBU1727981.1 DMT family transporter [Patescibacteria group bacterium]